MSIDSTPGASSDGNGVFEPGETVSVDPSWLYEQASAGGSCASCPTSTSLNGTAMSFTGPAGATYGIVDASANYGLIPLGESSSCSGTGNCYELSVSAPPTRPATHWDATFVEVPAADSPLPGLIPLGASSLDPDTCGIQAPPKAWTIHIGDSFSDVPRSSAHYKSVETLLHNGVAGGCAPTQYCPVPIASRGRMAIFMARGIAGGDSDVPVSGSVNGSTYNCVSGGVSLFTDVAPSDPFCRHVHYLAAQNVMPGCSASEFCPSDAVDRDGMAGIAAEAVVRPGGDAAVPLTYGPDPGTGLFYSCDSGAPNIHFTDVPVSDPLCKHVHYLWATGTIGGCSPTTYCPADGVSREGMSDFLVNALKLELYGAGFGISQPQCTPVVTPSGSTALCAGGSVTLDAGAGFFSYSWSPGGETTQTVVAGTPGVYTVTTTNVDGCTGTSAPVVVTILPPPVASAAGSATICRGGSSRLSGSGGVSCSWSPATGLSDPNYCNPIAGPSATTTYSLVVTNANGCVSTNAAEVTMTVVPDPVPVVTATSCLPAGTSGLLASVAGSPGDTYSWTLTGGAITSGQGTNEITFTSGSAGTLMNLAVAETSPQGCVGNATEALQVDFADVPPANPIHDDVCAVGRAAITAGCGSGDYCPGSAVTRAQMAVFLLRAEHGKGYLPPACQGVFPDVPCPSQFADWIEELAAEGITAGCGDSGYCPDSPVTRAQMAVFLLRTKHGAGYAPPACAGLFGDVGCPSPFADWIEELHAEGITAGCQASPPLYCPNNPNTRGQM
ncbi:MAG TPA: S-layer homology domain-containing protein, partial [Thermoanaerobaculia bacterium]|nr:S-layer homology domain-containing protein [Thermoanaerobaculia bacterium]